VFTTIQLTMCIEAKRRRCHWRYSYTLYLCYVFFVLTLASLALFGVTLEH